MEDSFLDSKKIAKNTIVLYVRQIVMMIISLFTTGIVMRELGVEDYGLYNVVGGIVLLFSVLQNTMAIGTQRFLNFEMGKRNTDGVREVFSISVILYYIVALVVVLLCETIGLWYLHNKLVIPEGRFFAANIVFQASIVTSILSITQTPYTADIIANEKMDVYGFFGVGEAFLRCILIVLLLSKAADKLIIFAIINLSVGIVFRIANRIYCIKNFEECRLRRPHDKNLLKEIISFSSWSLFSRVAYVGRDQGSALIVNRFFGVALNASMSVASNVSGVISSFVINFQTSYRPQLVKLYASGEKDEVIKLFFLSSKIASFLILLFSIPIAMNLDFLLKLWLGTIPVKCNLLILILLAEAFISALFAPFWMTIYAMGDIKKYQIVEGVFVMLTIPTTILAFQIGMSIELLYLIRIVYVLLLFIYAWHYLNKMINFPSKQYFNKILMPVIITFLISSIPTQLVGLFFVNWLRLFISSIVFLVIYIPVFFSVALSKNEKAIVRNYFSKMHCLRIVSNKK